MTSIYGHGYGFGLWKAKQTDTAVRDPVFVNWDRSFRRIDSCVCENEKRRLGHRVSRQKRKGRVDGKKRLKGIRSRNEHGRIDKNQFVVVVVLFANFFVSSEKRRVPQPLAFCLQNTNAS